MILDCPPSLGLLTVNALAAANRLIVPVQCEYYALEGLAQLLESVERIRGAINPGLALTGLLLTMYDRRTRLSGDVEREVRTHFGPKVFSSVVPRSVRLAEAPSHGLPITQYDPNSRSADAYYRLAWRSSSVDSAPPRRGLGQGLALLLGEPQTGSTGRCATSR